MAECYETYRDRLFQRHENRVTSALSTVADVVMVGAVAGGIAARRPRLVGAGLSVGFGLAVVAHLFQPGTLGEELSAVGRHPVWVLRAERERIFKRS